MLLRCDAIVIVTVICSLLVREIERAASAYGKKIRGCYVNT